jgi:3-oxo-5-alpha-steroid 4-dehydrogenase 1
MTERFFYHWLVIAWMGLAVAIFVTLFFISAPYGRFTRKGWGPRMRSRPGWMIMELPALLVFWLLFLLGRHYTQPVGLVFLVMWSAHYVHRALIFPFRLPGDRPSTTASVVLMAIGFNIGNAYLNGRMLYTLGPRLGAAWFSDPRFVVGILVFLFGFALNQHSDAILLRLRRETKTGYRIPNGGAYRWISCPNYLGEMVEWGGWALACWNLGALAFLAWTVANLAPRAVLTHRWYGQRFDDYPSSRKALIPFVL